MRFTFPTQPARLLGISALGAILALSACGGSDGGAGNGSLLAGDTESDIVDDTLENFGIDVDGRNDGADDAVESAIESSREQLEQFESDGSGTVIVGDITYAFTTQFCISFDGDFTATGPGSGSDGTDAWVDISYTYDTRDELLEFFDEGFVDMLTDGKDFAESLSVNVDVGRTDLYASGDDDAAAWSADPLSPITPLEWTIDGGSISGSGEITDFNGAALPFGETLPMTFEAQCG